MGSLNQGMQQLQAEIAHITGRRNEVEEKMQEVNLLNASLQMQVRERDTHIEGL